MPELILKQSLLDQKVLSGKPHQCHEAIENSKNNIILSEEQGFLASITCSFSCAGSTIKTHEIKENFKTSDLHMKRGDGDLWAGLSTTLQMWSSEICLKLAQDKCGSLNNIDIFQSPTIASGDWQLNDKISCNKTTSVKISPFEKTVKIKKNFDNISNALPDLKIKSTWLNVKENRSLSLQSLLEKPKKILMPEGCKKKITGSFCFGDCVTLDNGPMKELLSSPEPLRTDQFTICADELVEHLHELKLSTDVMAFYCEDYFITILKEQNATGLSCASSRVSVDCSELK